MVATLTAGLRDNSRLMQKACEIHATQQEILTAHIVDRLSVLIGMLSNGKGEFDSMVELLGGHREKNAQLMSFDTDDDFKAYWDRVNNGG